MLVVTVHGLLGAINGPFYVPSQLLRGKPLLPIRAK